MNTNRWNRFRYSLYAPAYDLVPSFRGPRKRSISLLALQAGERVLVDGAGTGTDLRYLPRGVEVVAVVPGPVRALREAARVLKPGGRAVVLDKFVPDDERPSRVRRAMNVVANALFSDLTRRLGPLLAGTGMEIVHRENASLGRTFEIALLRKRAGDEQARGQILPGGVSKGEGLG